MPEPIGNTNQIVPKFQMSIVSASRTKKDEMRWRSVNSDTESDLYDEKMSLELFSDFKRRIDEDLPVPEPFDRYVAEDGWNGGMPYLSLSHYRSAGGRNVPGEVKSVYVDGNRLKSHGSLHDNILGNAVYKSLLDDLYGEKKSDQDKVRISIGFLDLEHSHGDFVFKRQTLEDRCPACDKGEGNKVYLKGQLVHLAMTRVPVNPRTDMEVEKAMAKTKKEDAESIVGDAAELLEDKSLAGESTGLVLVLKTEEIPPVAVTEPVVTPAVVEPVVPETSTVVAPIVAESAVEVAMKTLLSKVSITQASNITGDTALQNIQPEFDALGEALKSNFAVPVAPLDPANIAALVNQAVAPIAAQMQSMMTQFQAQMATMKAQNTPVTPSQPVIPLPRTIKLGGNLTQKAGPPAAAMVPAKRTDGKRSIRELAIASTVGTQPVQ